MGTRATGLAGIARQSLEITVNGPRQFTPLSNVRVTGAWESGRSHTVTNNWLPGGECIDWCVNAVSPQKQQRPLGELVVLEALTVRRLLHSNDTVAFTLF